MGLIFQGRLAGTLVFLKLSPPLVPALVLVETTGSLCHPSEVEEKNDDDQIQCLVQLSTLPVAVCYGVGIDTKTANNDAARNALNYLKMMTKRTVQGKK